VAAPPGHGQPYRTAAVCALGHLHGEYAE
jgi:hypothetical protein